MSKFYDTTMKTLIDDHLESWVGFLCKLTNTPIGPAKALNTDLSTTLYADRLIQVFAEEPYLLHLELQSSSKRNMPLRMLRYNVNSMAVNKYKVLSILILLRPKADSKLLTGIYRVQNGPKTYLEFHYEVIRIWELAFEQLLNAGPGMMALSLLTDEAASDLQGSFRRLKRKLQDPAFDPKIHHTELGVLSVLLGLRYDPEFVQKLMEDAMFKLEDSSVYQFILDKGKQDGLQAGHVKGMEKGMEKGRQVGQQETMTQNILRLGTKRFGPAPNGPTSG